jgi:hypothetical protein
VFALLAGWTAWKGSNAACVTFAALSGSTLLVTLVRASLLHPLNKAWMKLAALLHAVVNPVVLGAIYYLLIAPIGIGMRWAGRDALRRRLEPQARTYWIERSPPGPAPDSLPNQF